MTATPDDVLNSILSIAYQAEIMGKKPALDYQAEFKTSMTDPAFAMAAKAKLSQLNSVDPGRCFISKTNADFLRRMLAN